jgi:hypothetical protein
MVALVRCDARPRADVAVAAAADAWSRQYASERLEARVSGNDCLVLLIRSRARLDRPTVESIHFGTPPYMAYEGGVQQFAEDRQFRAVVYRDGSGELWTYGSTTSEEAASLPVCR